MLLEKLKSLTYKTYGVHWYVLRFCVLLTHNELKCHLTWSHVHNALGIHTITRLNTCNELARRSIITRLCFSYQFEKANPKNSPPPIFFMLQVFISFIKINGKKHVTMKNFDNEKDNRCLQYKSYLHNEAKK